MQQPDAAPRNNLTIAQVVSLIQDAPAVTVGFGCELLDTALAVVDDLSPWFGGGSVSRSNYATLHGSAELQFTRELDWANALVRPYMTLTDHTVTARFNLGAYFAARPERVADAPYGAVTGFDICHILNDLVGDSYAVPAGASPLAEVESILQARGVVAYLIDQAEAAATLPTARTWAIGDDRTWLHIVNDLLGTVGYMGAWSDWDGRVRCVPYVNPRDRAPEWLYTVEGAASMLGLRRRYTADYFNAPNRWVAVRTSDPDGLPPTEGDGLYIYVNETDGPTSTRARGRTITAPLIQVDAASQAALVAAAQQRIDADMRLRTTVSLATAPNPLHWHFDRLALQDTALGQAVTDVVGVSWTLPLDGADMTHEWASLA